MNIFTDKRVPVRYTLLTIVLLLFIIENMFHQNWVADFWEHLASVNALKESIISPSHPIYAHESGPYQYFSPYSFSVAFISNLSNIDSLLLLQLFGPVNVLLLLVSIYILIIALFNDSRIAFYTILFTLFLWGTDAWVWSGFLHIGAIGLVQSYPSTNSTALSLLGLAFTVRFLNSKNVKWLIPTAFICWYAILTHTSTAVALYGGIIAICISQYEVVIQKKVFPLILLATLIPIAASLVWPYFNIATLTFGVPTQYHDSASAMYESPLSKIGPALLGIVALGMISIRKWRDPVVLMFVLYVIIYSIGGVSRQWSLGRVMPFIVLTLHIGLARQVVVFEDYAGRKLSSFPAYIYQMFVVLLSLVIVTILVTYQTDLTRRFLGSAITTNQPSYTRYDIVRRHVADDEIVIAKLWTGYIVPAFSGKIVATWGAQPFVETQQQRLHDNAVFFADTTSYETRRRILDAYGVKFILIDTTKRDEARMNLDDFTAFGSVIDENGGLILIRRDEPSSDIPITTEYERNLP